MRCLESHATIAIRVFSAEEAKLNRPYPIALADHLKAKNDALDDFYGVRFHDARRLFRWYCGGRAKV
jgi:hypothetical protein